MEMIRVESDAAPPSTSTAHHRDASTVFPKRTAAAIESAVGSALAAAGALKFVKEADLAKERAALGGSGSAGRPPPDPSKPLVEVLAAAKAAKQEAFDAAWKEMKVGGNRPLEADEAAFLASVAAAEAAKAAAAAADEKAEVAAFQAARAAAAEKEKQKRKGSGDAGALVANDHRPAGAAARPAVAVVRPVRTGTAAAAVKKRPRSASPPQNPPPPVTGAADADGNNPGLAGLLGAYGSGSESE